MTFPTRDDALFAAAQAILEATGGSTEATSAIYRMLDGSGYGFSKPKGSNERASVRATLQFPRGSALEALMHNHPEHIGSDGADHDRERFSATDIEQARELGVLSAIVYGNDMSMRTFEPGKDKVEKLKKQGTRIGGELSAVGRLFDYIPEVRVTARKLGAP